uniref:Urotensin-2B n=2 Tax=Cypriniformes TaxID=7952 RepID=UTS2B_CATCO|nr:RecName: Full=Urotensin-2B; AltName: Full=Urotensin IIB; Short=U-IIB; Short=UIIB [Catostomus commersonii]
GSNTECFWKYCV